MSALEPVGLATIAEAIRDQRLVDMRVVDVGTCERVVITQLNIAREKDSVLVTQKWEAEEDVHTEEFEFDAEDIRWLRETEKSIDQVQPIRLLVKPAAPPPQLLEAAIQNQLAKTVIDTIIRTYVFATGLPEADIRQKKTPDSALRARQECMWLAYEMTDLTPTEICVDHFGYKSAGPMALSVRYKIPEPKLPNAPGDPEFVKRVRSSAKVIDNQLGHKLRRAKPHGYWPPSVLP